LSLYSPYKKHYSIQLGLHAQVEKNQYRLLLYCQFEILKYADKKYVFDACIEETVSSTKKS